MFPSLDSPYSSDLADSRPASSSPTATAVAASAGILALSMISGILITAMIAPAVAMTGMAASTTAGMFDNLPDYIKPDALAQKSNIYAVDSTGAPVLLASVFEQNREEVGWDQISQFAKDAVIAIEDPRFYSHGGMDLASTLRAAVGNVSSGGVESGASTISMQYVKNILVQRAEALPDETERQAAYEEATRTSIDRKLKEIKLAIGLEKEVSKDDILLGYLNIAPFGGLTYGIQSASMYYYGVDAAGLTIAQAASLVAIVNQPNGLRIDRETGVLANQARRDLDVLPAMLTEQKITPAQFEEAVATPVTPNITPPSTGCTTANGIGAGFFCDYVGRVIANNNILEDETGQSSLATGGYNIYTTLDVDLQTAAQSTMNENVPMASDRLDLGSSLVTVQPGTGQILAMAQNKLYNADQAAVAPENTAMNYSTDYAHGGSTGFQVGSTYKVFTLAEWLEQGNGLNERVDGNSRPFNIATFQDSCTGAGTGTYAPLNDGGASPGVVSVLAATVSSVNNAYIAMAQRLDQCEIRKGAEAFGVARADGQPLSSFVSDVLGTNEIAPLNMAAAYAAIANNGVYCSPVAIERIVDSNGNELPVPQTDCAPATTPEVAATMAYALTAVVTNGTATQSNPRNGIPHFGKTGTTDSEKDTWFIGASSTLATAVWVGNVAGDVSIRNTVINGTNGGNLRHNLWRQYMTIAGLKYGGNAFPAPDQTLIQGRPVAIPDVVGMTSAAARIAIAAAGFEFQAGQSIDSALTPGTVISSSPTGTAVRGAVIQVVTSSGPADPTPPPVPAPMPTPAATNSPPTSQ